MRTVRHKAKNFIRQRSDQRGNYSRAHALRALPRGRSKTQEARGQSSPSITHSRGSPALGAGQARLRGRAGWSVQAVHALPPTPHHSFSNRRTGALLRASTWVTFTSPIKNNLTGLNATTWYLSECWIQWAGVRKACLLNFKVPLDPWQLTKESLGPVFPSLPSSEQWVLPSNGATLPIPHSQAVEAWAAPSPQL